MKDWLSALQESIQADRPAILVTIADAKGSAPREAGVKMLVTEDDATGTIGGGNLEYEAIRISRSILVKGDQGSELRNFALGPSLGQCCGGSTQLLFEPISAPPAGWIEPLQAFAQAKAPSVLASPIKGVCPTKLLVTKEDVVGPQVSPKLLAAARELLQKTGNAGARLWGDNAVGVHLLEQSPGHQGNVLLIGAGHVGKALANVLGTLPFAVTWADNRPEQYPDDIPANIEARCTPHLERVIDEAAKDTIYLVMTYSHDLDYALCARVLKRGDFRYLGLIGSKTKRARFERIMHDLGLDQTLIDRVVCPIGLDGISSKQPAVIAVATAAQILALGSFAQSGTSDPASDKTAY